MIIKSVIGAMVNGVLAKLGYEVIRKSNENIIDYPVEATREERELINLAGKYSMTGPVRMWALIQSLKHVKRKGLAGDLVECGVWKGGNLILMRSFANEFFAEKTVIGYDTFDGMTAATDEDIDYWGNKASESMATNLKTEIITNIHALAGLDTVTKNLRECSAIEKVKLVQGPVEKTLLVDDNLPGSISLLRLDTDWYESTKIELEILYPRLVSGGVLIIDDYGHFKGAQKAVDEYFQGRDIWLHYIDYTCRIYIKE